MPRESFSQGGNFIDFNVDFKAEITYGGMYSDMVNTEQFTGIKRMIIRRYENICDFTFCADHNDIEQSVLIINADRFISLKLERE